MSDSIQIGRAEFDRMQLLMESMFKALKSAERELERWRHGTTIEGDDVCPHELEAHNMRSALLKARDTFSDIAGANYSNVYETAKAAIGRIDRALDGEGGQE